MESHFNNTTQSTQMQGNHAEKKANENIMLSFLNSNIQNVNFFISSIVTSKTKVQQEAKDFMQKVKITAKYLDYICEDNRKHYSEIKEKLEEIVKKGGESKSDFSQQDLFKLMEETSNCSRFYDFTTAIDKEIKNLNLIQENSIFKETVDKAFKFLKALGAAEELNDSQISKDKTNETLLKRKRLRSSDGESTNNPEEIVDKEYQITVLNETEAQTTNLNTTEQNSEPKPKRDRKGMKREMIALGLNVDDYKRNTVNPSNNPKAAVNISSSKAAEEKQKEKEKDKTNNISNNNVHNEAENKAKANVKSSAAIINSNSNEKSKGKVIPKKPFPNNLKNNNNSNSNNNSNYNEKNLKKKSSNSKEGKGKDAVEETLGKKKIYKNDEEIQFTESISSEESYKIEVEKVKRTSASTNHKKKANKTYNNLVKITKYHNQLDNNIIGINTTNLDSSNGDAVCPVQLGNRDNNFDEDEDESYTKNIVLENSEKIQDVVLNLTDHLTDLCELIGKESNTINDYLMTNLENCLFIKRLYYSEFDLTNKSKKFNYEYLTKDNNLIEKIENFENVKLVIVRKGKQNINNLLKSMENFFKIYIKRKDVDGSAMIKGVLNCSFDKLQKYYNMHMRSFDYCEAIQIEVFLFKWDLFMDFNENYDKTNMNKKEIAELINYGQILHNTRILTKKRNMLKAAPSPANK